MDYSNFIIQAMLKAKRAILERQISEGSFNSMGTRHRFNVGDRYTHKSKTFLKNRRKELKLSAKRNRR